MKKKSRKRIIITIIAVLILAGVGFFLFKYFNRDDVDKVSDKNKIVGYSYTKTESDPEVYQTLFDALKTNLEGETINEEEYAKSIASMFVFEFYNLDDKISKNDVGGVEYVYPTNRTNFIDEAVATVYKYVEHNLYGDRKQQLPVVSSITVAACTKGAYEYTITETVDDKETAVKKTDDEAYTVKVTITYKISLGYPNTITVKLIHDDKYLYIVEMK